MVGSHWCARSGQLALKKTALSEFVGYDLQPIGRNAAILHGERTQFPSVRRRETSSELGRSDWCVCATGPPADVTSETVMPLPPAADARSSQNCVRPSLTKRTVTVVSPAIFVALIAQVHAKDVVLHIHAGLALIMCLRRPGTHTAPKPARVSHGHLLYRHDVW